MPRAAAPEEQGAGRPPVRADWAETGFGRLEAQRWRDAGWVDPYEAAEWRDASPEEGPELLHSLRDAGYQPDQIRAVGRSIRRHLGAWAAATIAPADPRSPRHHGSDLVIDLRDRADEPATVSVYSPLRGA